jgi:hypothetical protein
MILNESYIIIIAILKEMNNDLSHLIGTINNEISKVVNVILLPFFETMQREKENMKIIESILKQMPEFKRLEQENKELKDQLQKAQETTNTPKTIKLDMNHNPIKLEIIDTVKQSNEVISETEFYEDDVVLVNKEVNVILVKEEISEAAASEAAASEAEEEASEAEEEASEAEEEASEAEEEASEAEEEASEAASEEEASEAAASEAGEEASEAEEASEEEAAEASEAEEEEEEEAAEASEAGDEEEVYIVEIKGRGKFFTSNETNGDIYAIEGDDDVGEQVGKFVNTVPTFYT